MKIKAFINWKNYDKDGKLISETEHEANSFVKTFLQTVLIRLFDSITVNCIDTGGAGRNTSYLANSYVDAAANNDDYGILVGTGANAVTITDYALQTKIADGAGAGQLLYGACTVDADVSVDGSTAYFQLYRTFTNSSGGSITIKEIGVVKYSGTYYLLLERSLSENTIADAASSTLTYKISITV